MKILGFEISRSSRTAGADYLYAPSQEVPEQKGSIAPFDRLSGVTMGGMANGQKLQQPYKNSVWVQRAIKKVSGPICAVPLEFTADGRGGKQKVSNPALMEFWQAPAVSCRTGSTMRKLTLAQTIEATVGWLKLEGESFWVLENKNVPFPEVGGGLRPFLIARPDRMRAVLNSNKELTDWEFTDAGGRRTLLDPEQVVQFKCWNPYSEIRGLAEYEAARDAAEADYLAGRFNLNLMRNNGDTGPIVVGKSGMPDDTQQAQIIELLRMKKEMSLRGEFRPVFIGGDIEVEDPQIKTPDAAFIEGRIQNKYEIFQAFGVPPSMADKMESYSVGSASDWYMLITETCMPASSMVCDGIEEVVRLQTGQRLYGRFGWEAHPVMQAVRRERIENGTKLWDRGMPWEKVNEYLDLGLVEFEGWEQGYIPFSLTPVGEAGALAPEVDPALGENHEDTKDTKEEKDEADEADEAIEAMFHALRCNHGVSRGGAETRSGEIFQRARPEKEVAQWKTLMAMRRGSVKLYQAKFNKALFGARAEVLRKLESAEGKIALAATPERRALALDFLFDLKKFKGVLFAEMRSAALETLKKAGEELFKEVGKEDPWKMADPKAQAFLRERENKLTDVAEDVFRGIKSELELGLEAGESTKALADRIRSKFNGFSKERAMRVAMTETNAAYGTARQEAMTDAGVEFKKWLTSGNANVRPAHQEANQQVVKVDEPFEVGGEELMHPGDPSGSAENVINCHCVSIAIAGKPEGD